MLSSTSNSLASLFKEVYDQKIRDLIPTLPTLPNCCMCKENLLYHLNGLDHPFFHDNLEFLEWKYEQKKTLVGEEI